VTLYPAASTANTAAAVMGVGTVMTVANVVTGDPWYGTCTNPTAQGSAWYRIVALNGTPISALFGVNEVYALAGAFQPGVSPSPTPTPTPVIVRAQGIDVSYHQGTINWQQVAAAGKSFAYIKSTEGTQYVDPAYFSYRAGALAAGLRVGVYHYAQPGTAPGGAAVQADHFIDVSGWVSGDLLPVLDIEQTNGLTSTALQAWVAEFLDRIYVRTGVHAGVYTSPSFWRTYLADNSSIAQNGYNVLWVAHWTTASAPSMPAFNWAGYGWTIWQYTDRGTVPGVNTLVDLDRLNGTDFSRLLIP
jgi:GH25 family lysozyme M1 (1,4-beta-N-acetylmuramidase)